MDICAIELSLQLFHDANHHVFNVAGKYIHVHKSRRLDKHFSLHTIFVMFCLKMFGNIRGRAHKHQVQQICATSMSQLEHNNGFASISDNMLIFNMFTNFAWTLQRPLFFMFHAYLRSIEVDRRIHSHNRTYSLSTIICD